MLSTPEFKKFSGEVVLFLHNTSHVDGEPYPNLLREKGGNGYPTVSYLDHTGRLLTQMPFPTRSTDQLRKMLERLRAWRKLRAAHEAGDKGLAAKLFLLEMDFGMLGHAEGEKRLRAVRAQLEPDQIRRVQRALVNLEFRATAATITRDKKTLIAAGEKFVGMMDRDRIPTSREVITFWQGALAYAESKRDAKLFERIFETAKKKMAGDPRVDRYMERVKRRLQALKRQR